MSLPDRPRPGSRNLGQAILITSASVVVLVAGLRAGRELLVPVAVAVFLSIVLLPAVIFLQRGRVPVAASVVAVILLMLGTLALVGTLIGSSFHDFDARQLEYRQRWGEIWQQAPPWLKAVAPGRGPLTGATEGVPQGGRPEAGSSFDLGELVDPTSLLGTIVKSFLQGVTSLFSNTFLVLLLLALLLVEEMRLSMKLREIFGSRASMYRVSRIMVQVQRYLWIKTGISLVTGLLAGLLVYFLGVDFPVLWGLLAFLLNYIPNIGSIIAAFPPILLAMLQFGSLRAGLVAAGFAVINVGMGSILEPQLLGKRLGLSPLVIFVSMVFWGWTWGPVGMLLAVPLTMSVKIVFENTNDMRWVGQLMDSRARKDRRGKEPETASTPEGSRETLPSIPREEVAPARRPKGGARPSAPPRAEPEGGATRKRRRRRPRPPRSP